MDHNYAIVLILLGLGCWLQRQRSKPKFNKPHGTILQIRYCRQRLRYHQQEGFTSEYKSDTFKVCLEPQLDEKALWISMMLFELVNLIKSLII